MKLTIWRSLFFCHNQTFKTFPQTE